jgi:hypothetical protein
MEKIIVTHKNPDLDAICSVWLLRKYDQQFQDARVEFVYPGDTFQDEPVDSNDTVIHVDTGEGKFDHHQYVKKTSAAKLVFEYLKKKYTHLKEQEALIRLINIVTDIDHFGQCLWPEADSDRYSLMVYSILNGLKMSGKLDDYGLVGFGSKCLDGVFHSLKIKLHAEKELLEGKEFTTKWGKALGVETENDKVLKQGQKKGYILVVRKDPEYGNVRIKARPDSNVDFTELKAALEAADQEADWYLHISKKMLLNGSLRNPKIEPTQLSLERVIQIIKDKAGEGVSE